MRGTRKTQVLVGFGVFMAVGAATVSCGSGNSGTFLPDAGADTGGGSGGGSGGNTADGGSPTGGAAGSDTGGTSGTGGGSGVACRSDTECTPYNKLCDAVAGECVECLFDSTCGEGRQCRNRTCVDMVACTSSLDCAGQETAHICDQSTGVCEECVDDDDCGSDGECLRNVCSYFVRCTSSLNCPQGQVCDILRGRCAQCADALDCETGQTCYNGECTTRCISDKDCVGAGKLCDKTVNACVACLQHSNCPQAFHCKSGECVLDVCESGVQACNAQTIVECTQAGDSMQNVGNCAGQTTCQAADGDATCAPWVCTAGQTYCTQDHHLVQCSADGLKVLSDRDCTTDGLKCFSGECKALLCEPNSLFCHEGNVQRCSADGLSSWVQTTCSPSEYCDSSTNSCQTKVCTPNAPACNGTIATTCNADGSGYLSGGTNCSNTSTACSMGTCINCSDGRQAASGAQFLYVFPSYGEISILNAGPCTISGYSLYVHNSYRSSSTATIYTDYDSVYYALYPQDYTYTYLSMNTSTTGSNLLLLCYQDCSSTANIIDVIQLGTGISPPTGITFANPLANVSSGYYWRSGYAGKNPSFTGSDWTHYYY